MSEIGSPEQGLGKRQEHIGRVQKYYDATQVFYEIFWHGKALGLHYGFWLDGVRSRKEAILKENEVLADFAGVKQNDLVLDAGCGIGGSSVWLAKERGANVVGLNIVNKQITKGKDLVKKRKLAQRVSFVKGDYQQLPFNNEVFDVYWSLESIEHVTNLKDLMTEAFRVLKPGGKIIIATFLGNREDISPEQARQIAIARSVAGVFNDFCTVKASEEIMKEVGFVNLKNLDMTEKIIKSAEQMTKMCRRLGVPAAKALSAVHAVSPIMVPNNQWGTYQEGLFKSGAISYNVLLATKPE